MKATYQLGPQGKIPQDENMVYVAYQRNTTSVMQRNEVKTNMNI